MGERCLWGAVLLFLDRCGSRLVLARLSHVPLAPQVSSAEGVSRPQVSYLEPRLDPGGAFWRDSMGRNHWRRGGTGCPRVRLSVHRVRRRHRAAHRHPSRTATGWADWRWRQTGGWVQVTSHLAVHRVQRRQGMPVNPETNRLTSLLLQGNLSGKRPCSHRPEGRKTSGLSTRRPMPKPITTHKMQLPR